MKKEKNANGFFAVILIAIVVFITLGVKLYHEKHPAPTQSKDAVIEEVSTQGYVNGESTSEFQHVSEIETVSSEDEVVSVPVGYSFRGNTRYTYYLSENDVIKINTDGNEDIFRVPSGAEYVGISDNNGLVFISKTEDEFNKVLLLDFGFNEFKTIADDVEKILELDYEYSEDLWAQPLFLMEDGSVTIYLNDGQLHTIDDYELKNNE